MKLFQDQNVGGRRIKKREGKGKTATGVILLKADYRNRTKQLEDKQLFVGGKVESLLAELGLVKESPEIKNWLLKVRGFYEEAVFKIIKYFSQSIKSKTLRSLAVLAPTSWSGMELNDLKKCWRVLGQQFSNVIQVSELPGLMVDVAALKVQGSTGDPDKMEVDEFFSNLSKVTDDEGNLVFPLLSKLGSALATLYNSSSMAERDFRLMNAIVSDKSRTSPPRSCFYWQRCISRPRSWRWLGRASSARF